MQLDAKQQTYWTCKKALTHAKTKQGKQALTISLFSLSLSLKVLLLLKSKLETARTPSGKKRLPVPSSAMGGGTH
jgi:hypothetical protein